MVRLDAAGSHVSVLGGVIYIYTTKGKGEMILEEKKKKTVRKRKNPPPSLLHIYWPFFFKVMTPTQFSMTERERERTK